MKTFFIIHKEYLNFKNNFSLEFPKRPKGLTGRRTEPDDGGSQGLR